MDISTNSNSTMEGTTDEMNSKCEEAEVRLSKKEDPDVSNSVFQNNEICSPIFEDKPFIHLCATQQATNQ